MTSNGVGLGLPAAPGAVPSCPSSLNPQQRTVCTVVSAQLNCAAALTDVNVNPGAEIRPGVVRGLVFPVPSCPNVLVPQQYTFPVVLKPQA